MPRSAGTLESRPTSRPWYASTRPIGALLSTASYRVDQHREQQAPRRRLRSSLPAPLLLALGGLTLLGFGLRLAGLHQSLFGDELFLYAVATRHSLGAMLSAVHDTESTPPFHFLLAWVAGKLGDPTIAIRLPSLILGTAVIPLTYLVGVRALSRPAALLGASFVAISPFAIWYADEARAYATLTFLSALSTLALLMALQTHRRRWWLLYALAACLVLYTHYMGVFVVVAQAAWAAWSHRERWRELVTAHAAIALGYLLWLPSFAFQSHDTSAARISRFKTFTPKGAVRELTISFTGHPFLPLRDVPGRGAMLLVAFGVAVAAAGALTALVGQARPAAWARRRPALPGDRSTLALIALLAAATPTGVAFFSVVGQNSYIPRNLSASLPALCLLLGVALTTLRRPLAVAATAAILAALGIGTVRGLEAVRGRPPYRQAAHFIDARAGPSDMVVEYPLFANYANTGKPLGRHLDVQFKVRHAFEQARSYQSLAWADAIVRRRVFVVLPSDAAHEQSPPLPPALRPHFRLVRRASWKGLVPVSVVEYAIRQRSARG